MNSGFIHPYGLIHPSIAANARTRQIQPQTQTQGQTQTQTHERLRDETATDDRNGMSNLGNRMNDASQHE